MRFFSLLLFGLAIHVTSAQNLEQFISHPIESNLVSSINGKYLAWLISDHGKQNIMLRSGSDFPKLFTDYSSDDGQEISQLLFSPNGTKLVFVRGKGASQFIFIKDVLSKNPPAKITQGHSPVFLPDGLGMLFSKDGQIYQTSLDINAVPNALLIPGDKNTAPKFSPAGNEILFVSDRGNSSVVGIYNLTSKKTRWTDSQLFDDYACWSPDGKQVAFIRTETPRRDGPSNYSQGKKFSICTASTETLATKIVWQSPADDGGFAQQMLKPLTWTSSNRILFFSEHTGWNHIFSMNPDGTDLKDITPGDGEARNFIMDVAGQNIYFDSNREDLDRRHIWKSNIKIGTPTPVTKGDGIEVKPVLSGENLFCVRSTFNAAMSVVRVEEYQKITLPVFPQKLPAFSSSYFVKPEKVTFQSPDGTTLYGQLFIDRKITGKRGGIVYVHGGPHRQMLAGFHPLEYYTFTYVFNQYLASMGYAVLTINYRGGTGYGKTYRVSSNQLPADENQYKDLIAGAKFLQLLPEVEKTKIGVWGGSYGGYLAAKASERNPEIFKAAVDLHCVVDWTFESQDPTSGWSVSKIESATSDKKTSTPAKTSSPLLLMHGNDSTTTEFRQAVEMEKKLRASGAPVEVVDLKDEIHFKLKYDHWTKIFMATKDFFDKRLK